MYIVFIGNGQDWCSLQALLLHGVNENNEEKTAIEEDARLNGVQEHGELRTEVHVAEILACTTGKQRPK